VAHQLETRVAQQMLDVGLAAGEVVVDAQHVVSALEQALAQVRAEKAGTTGHQNPLHARTCSADHRLATRVAVAAIVPSIARAPAARRGLGSTAESLTSAQFESLR